MNEQVKYQIIGRYREGNEITAYQVQSVYGQERMTRAAIGFLCGQNKVTNARAQIGRYGELMLNGVNCDLGALPTIKDTKTKVKENNNLVNYTEPMNILIKDVLPIIKKQAYNLGLRINKNSSEYFNEKTERWEDNFRLKSLNDTQARATWMTQFRSSMGPVNICSTAIVSLERENIVYLGFIQGNYNINRDRTVILGFSGSLEEALSEELQSIQMMLSQM